MKTIYEKVAVMLGFAVLRANRFVAEHREIISDNEVKFLIRPITSLDRPIWHDRQDRFIG